jgi:hypothetical protein
MSSKKNPFLEEEAQQESDAEEELSDSSEDDEGLDDLEKLREENADFIVDEDEDDDDEDDVEGARPSSSRRKRRRRKRSQLELDDEDLSLVEENTVRLHNFRIRLKLLDRLSRFHDRCSLVVPDANQFRCLPGTLQGKKIKRNKRVFKRQEETAAPVGRDGLAREFGIGDDFRGLEGALACGSRATIPLHAQRSVEPRRSAKGHSM